MLLRRGPVLIEGYSLEAARALAKDQKEAQESREEGIRPTRSKTGKAAKKGSISTTASRSAMSTISPEAAGFLAYHGVPFIEVYEAGYGPAVEKARRAQQGYAQYVAQETGSTVGAEVAVKEQRAAVRTAAQYERARKELENEYRKAKSIIEARYQEALAELRTKYNELKAQGVGKVEYNGQVMSLDEWYRMAQRELAAWSQRELQKLEKWKKQQKLALDKALAEIEESIAKWKLTALKQIDEYVKKVREYRKKLEEERKKAEEVYKEWLRQQVEKAKKITREDALKEFADRVYRYAYEYWRRLGLSKEEASRRAEEARTAVLKAGEKTVKAVGAFEEWLKNQYEKYAAYIAAGGAAAGTSGGIVALLAGVGAAVIVARFRQEAMEKARELGVPEDIAKQYIKAYLDALEKTAKKGVNYGKAVRELDRLYGKYLDMMRSKLSAATGTSAVAVSVAAQLELLVDRFKREAREVLSKHGITGEDAEKLLEEYVSRLDNYRKTIINTVFEMRKLRERAENIYKTWRNEALRNISFYFMNRGRFKEELKKKLLRELSSLARTKDEKDYARKLAEYYAEKWLADVVNTFNQRYNALPAADFICQKAGRGLFCKVYRNGVYVGAITVQYYSEDHPDQLLALAMSIGYKPGRLYVVNSEKELEQAELAYLREVNPRAYMARLGSKAFSWEGGLSPSDIYRNIKEFTSYVEEFYRVPAEKLAEKAVHEGGAKGVAEAVAASAAMFGVGVLSGIMNIWDVPGMVEFAKETVKTKGGNIVSVVKENPLMISYMAGTIVGAEAGFRGLGKLKKLGEQAIGRYIPPEKLGMPERITLNMPSTHRLPGLDLPNVPPEVIAKVGRAAHYSEELKQLISEYMAGKVKPEELVRRGLEIYEELEKKGVLGSPTYVYHATPYKFPKEFEVLPSHSPTPGLYVSPVPYPKFAVSGVTRVGLLERLRWKLEGIELPSEPTILKLKVEGVELPKLGRPLEPPPETGAYARIVPGYTKWNVFTRARGFIAKEARRQPKAYITPEVYGGLLWRLRAELESIIPVGAKFRETLRTRILRPYTEVEVPVYEIMGRRVVEGVSREKLPEIVAKLREEGFNQFVYSEKTGKLYAYKARPTGEYVRVKIRVREYEPVRELLERARRGKVTPEEFARELGRLEKEGAIEVEIAGKRGGTIYTTGLAERGALVGRSVLGLGAGLRAASLTVASSRSALETGLAGDVLGAWRREEGLLSGLERPAEYLVAKVQPRETRSYTPGLREARPRTPSMPPRPGGAAVPRLEEPAPSRIETSQPTTPRSSWPAIPRPEESTVPRLEQPTPPKPPEIPPPRPETPPPHPQPPEEVSLPPPERVPPPPPPRRGPPPQPPRWRAPAPWIRTPPPLPRLKNAQETWGKTKMKTPKSVVGELLLF